MDKKYVNSLWDPICTGDEMFLYLSKQKMKKLKIKEDELLLESTFDEYGTLKTLQKVLLRLYPKFLVIIDP